MGVLMLLYIYFSNLKTRTQLMSYETGNSGPRTASQFATQKKPGLFGTILATVSLKLV